ncbi:MAG: LysR family transcriptional regulator [Pseudomonadota bacterium]|nr:LysR family transcriptional regulator [Pseudomonadota bacterium]MEE3069745.1 LysR family transcriptional regulator [Pseudomonadota bacterium]
MVDSPGRITLWGIEVFVATAEEGSISAAARRLATSPSTVSQQLTGLEAAIGATLLVRNARPVALTPAGELFRRRASTILNEAAQARAELALADFSALTRLRLGMIEDLEADVTPALLAHLAGEMRSCQFLLETGASHALYGQLDDRALDLVVAAEIGDEAEWMEVHPLLSEPYVLAVPKGLIDPQQDIIDQLRKRTMIQYSTRHYMGRMINSHLARQNLKLSHRFEIDSYHAVLALVADGAGWSILTPLALMRARRLLDRVDVLPLPFAPLSRNISLTARQGILGTIPAEIAQHLRGLLDQHMLTPAIERYPFLEASLHLR